MLSSSVEDAYYRGKPYRMFQEALKIKYTVKLEVEEMWQSQRNGIPFGAWLGAKS